MAGPVIRTVFNKAQKFLNPNFELQKDTKKMVKELTITLLLCERTFKEVEKQVIINNRALADLLRMLKETVYDAEDVLDNMEAKYIKEKVQGKNKVWKFASSSLSTVGNMFVHSDNLKSLNMVLVQLNKLSTDIPKVLKLVNMIENNESHTREVTIPRETKTISRPIQEVVLYGRQNELKQILDIILGSELKSSKKGAHDLFVIPIVGMGGVGKTALAQAVYNNLEVQQTFAKRAWISVSNKLNVDAKSVMREIYQSLGFSSPDLITLQNIFTKITLCIGSEGKFLIVLDDLFEIIEYEWECLYETLSHCAPDSVVLITTQNQVLANRVGTFRSIALSPLDSGIFWELFEHFAFRNEEIPEVKGIILKSIGKKIAAKLRGLPLAAIIIGNILRSDINENRWETISSSEWWDMPHGKYEILPSIAYGYKQLDPWLQRCFSYCALFPRKSLIEKDRLVHMWIAQNFIQADDNGGRISLEDIGRQWFDELVEKSFFQRAGDDNSYVMHDLMHDLAVIVSSGECFYLGEGLAVIPLGVRHLAVDTNNLAVIRGIKIHKNLRSFLYFRGGHVEGIYNAINDTLSNLDSIKVLDLSNMSMENNSEPPPAIWKLQHLRFLDLSSTGITVLTRSSVYLYDLQALYIRKCKFQELPRGINMCHLYADDETIGQISGIGQLTNLQELGVFFVGKMKGHRITELRNLRQIRGTLVIKNFENIQNKEEAKLANLANKIYLDSICFSSNPQRRWTESNVDMEVLEGLQPHKDIKNLVIHKYFGSQFPKWIIQIGNFLNLSTLHLISCVNVEVLPPLGELPSLEFLHIEELSSIKLINYHLYGKRQTVFPLLEKLVLGTLSNCKEWTDEARAGEFFPLLSKLIIYENETLRIAPLHLFSSSLKELTIYKCNNLISLENSIRRLSYLTHLELYSSSTSFSFAPLDMPLLQDLYLGDCPELQITGDLKSLTHLKHLRLLSCSKLFITYSTMDQQKGKGLQVHRDEGLQSLTHIEADHSLLHHEYPIILGSLPSLKVLIFSEITQFTNHQILWFQELAALQEINFFNCEFEHLPASLSQLSSLEKMELIECRKLESLSDSMPPNLQKLYLMDCSPNLVQLCQAYKGKDQQCTSSIPVIHIGDTSHMGQILDAPEVKNMEIRKPQISDAIGRQSCASCGKTFELSDLVLRNFNFMYES